MGRHTIRQTSSISLLFTTFISECSHLFVSEILKNVNSLRGDLPHAPGNMPSISTPGVGQPIPLRRFLPHHGQLLNDVDTWTHTFEIRLPPLLFPQIPVGPCGNVTDFFCTFRSLLLTEFNRLSANVSQDVQATFRLIEQMLGREQPPPS